MPRLNNVAIVFISLIFFIVVGCLVWCAWKRSCSTVWENYADHEDVFPVGFMILRCENDKSNDKSSEKHICKVGSQIYRLEFSSKGFQPAGEGDLGSVVQGYVYPKFHKVGG